MDTDLLRTFIEVSKTRHFGRAAETLYLTQSAVSFRIRQLEQQLGVTLFARHRNNIQLTLAGERLYPYAEAILQTLGRAKIALLGIGRDTAFIAPPKVEIFPANGCRAGRLRQHSEPALRRTAA